MSQRLYDRFRAAVTDALPVNWSGGVGMMFAPSDIAVLIGRAMISPHVPAQTKAYIIMAGLYTGSGLDIVPEALLGPIGFADDSIVIIEALHRLLNDTHPAVLAELWSGDFETINNVRTFVWSAREGLRRHVVRPIALWLRRIISQAVAGRAT